jgi:hypothetical protein
VAGLPYCAGHARMAYRPASSANRSAMAGIPRSRARMREGDPVLGQPAVGSCSDRR